MSVDVPANSELTTTGNGQGALVALDGRGGALAETSWSHAIQTRPAILNSSPNPVQLWHALRRRWAQAVGLGLVAASVCAACVWFFVPVKYEVASTLRVSGAKSKFNFRQGGGDSLNDSEFSIYKRTQAALIKHHFVLTATLRKPEVARLPLVQKYKDDPIGWLDKQLSVDFPGDAEIMKISMKGDEPDQLVKIVNSVKDAYMDEIVNAERDSQLRQRDTLEQNYQKNREEIRKKSGQIRELAEKIGTTDSKQVQIKQRLALEQLDVLIKQRNNIEEQIKLIDIKMLLVKARNDQSKLAKLPAWYVDQQFSRDPAIQHAQQRLALLREVLLEEKQRALKPNSRSVKDLRSRIDALKEEIEEMKSERLPDIADGFREGGAEGQSYSLPLLETEREALTKNLEKATISVARHMEETQKLERSSTELESRKAELEELQGVTKVLGTELRTLAIDLYAPARITLIEAATSPSGNDAMRKYTHVGLASMLGFVVVLLGVAYVEFQPRRLNSVEDVNDGLGIRVMGDLPALSGRAWRRIQKGKDSYGGLQHMLAESIDSIRTTLIYNTSVEAPRVVMVTSADAHEGKTTVASQLAVSLARSGRRTLLVDGDLRNPAAHRVFELPQEPGLCELLRGQAPQEGATHPTRAANLWLIPAGRCCAESVQALSSGALSSAFTTWRAQFDFVVIDSGPVLKMADPLLLGQHVDAAIISVLRDVSRVPKIYDACERLKAVGVTVLGAVVNGVNHTPAPRNHEMLLSETVQS